MMTRESWQIQGITTAARLATLKGTVSVITGNAASTYLMKNGKDHFFLFSVHLQPLASWVIHGPGIHSARVPNWKPPASGPSFDWLLQVVL